MDESGDRAAPKRRIEIRFDDEAVVYMRGSRTWPDMAAAREAYRREGVIEVGIGPPTLRSRLRAWFRASRRLLAALILARRRRAARNGADIAAGAGSGGADASPSEAMLRHFAGKLKEGRETLR
uniref:Uncharacterized protein n=1 Tax=Rhodopseudomonas palustris (strain DX-1) TaxID=652103 RepID=E6VFJ7_RHOPX